MVSWNFSFFFQAEDGIRDDLVTGVQTCALPISQNHGLPLRATTHGSNHIRYVGNAMTLRLTTDAAVTAILEENPFFVDDAVTLVVGPDETLQDRVDDVGKRFLSETTAYWRGWERKRL